MEGNRRRIDGRFIFVKKSVIRDTIKSKQEPTPIDKVQSLDVKAEGFQEFSGRDNRSYRDTLLGSRLHGVAGQTGVCDTERDDHIKIVKEKSVNEDANAVNFEIDLPKNDMDWLFRSAIGRPSKSLSFEDVHTALKMMNVECLLAPMGGVTVLVTFRSKEEMKLFLIDNKS
ncbi:hypothetical protein REPUB_Repub02eG0200200 [Reevesia pubescens]